MLSVLSVVPPTASALTLSWDANPEPVAGYKVHYGLISGLPATTVDAGDLTAISLPNPPPGETWYFSVTAYDAFATDGPPSNEVAFTTPLPMRQFTITTLYAPSLHGPWIVIATATHSVPETQPAGFYRAEIR